jgi:hypothetical protein
VQDLRPNSQDTTVFYLDNIFQLLASSNVSLGTTTPSTLVKPPPFTPPNTAIWVNSFWFLSLSMSLTCAMLATLQLQWAHRYIAMTHSRHSPHTRARIRAYFAEGLRRLSLPWMIQMLPTLLHLSLFLFFAGLSVYLYNVNVPVFKAVNWWITSCLFIYIYVTLMPLFWHNSPYCTPLTSTAWFIYTCTFFIFLQTLKWITSYHGFSSVTHRRFCALTDKYKRWLFHGVLKAIEESALNRSSELDGHAFIWALEASDEDDKLERFFAGLPGFCSSKVVDDPLGLSIQPNRERLSVDLMGLICRTLSSNIVSDSDKIRRMKVCAEAMEAASLPITRGIFDALYQRNDWEGLLSSVDFGLVLRKANHNDRETACHSQLIISTIIAKAQKHDARWSALVTGQLGIPESVLSRYLYHGDSASLANCIHVLRCIVRNPHCPIGSESLIAILKSVSKFAVQDTLPELQHEFCALWNENVFGMCNSDDSLIRHTSLTVLGLVWHLFLSIHQGTSAASRAFSPIDHDDIQRHRSSYPLCDIPAHYPRSDSGSRTPEVIVGEKANDSLAPPFIVPCCDAVPITATAISLGVDKPSFLSPNLGHLGAFPTDAASPGDLSAIMPHYLPVAVLPHLVPSRLPTASVDGTTPTTHGTVHAPVISYLAFPVHCIPQSGSSAPSPTGDTTTPPPFTFPSAISSPSFIPAPGRLHSDSAAIGFGDTSHGLTSPSSATTSTWSPSAPQATFDPNVNSSYRTLNAHNDAQNMNRPVHTETSYRPYSTGLTTPERFLEKSRPGSRNSFRESASLARDSRKS